MHPMWPICFTLSAVLGPALGPLLLSWEGLGGGQDGRYLALGVPWASCSREWEA